MASVGKKTCSALLYLICWFSIKQSVGFLWAADQTLNYPLVLWVVHTCAMLNNHIWILLGVSLPFTHNTDMFHWHQKWKRYISVTMYTISNRKGIWQWSNTFTWLKSSCQKMQLTHSTSTSHSKNLNYRLSPTKKRVFVLWFDSIQFYLYSAKLQQMSSQGTSII